MNVIKRDGRVVLFDKTKIRDAVLKAFQEVDNNITSESSVIADKISDEIENYTGNDLTIDDIQNLVEKKLMSSKRKDVAKAYIEYRFFRDKERERNSHLFKEIWTKLNASDVQNQNANMDEKSFGGRIGEAANTMMKSYALKYCMSDMARKNHENNEIYIHDLDHYAIGNHNCLSIPFDDLLANGFNTRQTDVRPAQSVSTAFQLVAVIFQLQSLQQFGGVAATHLDWTMVPYVRKSFYKHYRDGLEYIEGKNIQYIQQHLYDIINDSDCYETEQSIDNEWWQKNEKSYKYATDMTKREIKQAVEGMYHNLNTLQSRSGNQLPFTSINYGTCTLTEGRMITKALLEVSIEGIGKLHKTSIFPCGIFQCMKGVNRKPDEPNYDLFKLALESTSKRLYPNYVNVDWSINVGYDKNDPRTYTSTMGCRTYNGYDINGLGQLKDGRGNICPVTIILPTLAMEVKADMIDKHGIEAVNENESHVVNKFIEYLDKKIHEAKDMLIERFEYICKQPSDSAKFMYENNVMTGYIPEEGIRSALKHGTLALGQIGLAETLQILIGCDLTKEKGLDLAKRIEKLFADRCKEFNEEYKLNIGVYFSPAENLCYTSMKKFREKYGIIPNVSENDFFTNSTHVPVWKEITAVEKINIEAELAKYSSAGCIVFTELSSSARNNLVALESLVNYAMDKDIPYFAINVPNDTCLDCGYCDEFNNCCPVCGSKNIQQLRRVTGYLTGNYKTAFNLGKQHETEMRIKHM